VIPANNLAQVDRRIAAIFLSELAQENLDADNFGQQFLVLIENA
jgi:hypothetical protein